MSASEKLAGWDRALPPGTFEPRSATQEDVAFWEIRRALPQIVAVVQAAEMAARKQQEALEIIRANGFVFEDIGKEPGNWQHLAFTLYTELCEIDAFSSPAVRDLDEVLL